MSHSIESLRAQFNVLGVTIEPGSGGLTRVRIATPLCAGEIYLHGAHVAAFMPAGHEPVIWMSKASAFAPTKAIRGGVPICYPWFGANATHPEAPQHGVARTAEWELVDVGLQPSGEINVILKLPPQPVIGEAADEAMSGIGDGRTVETYFAALFGTELEIGLLVKNNGTHDIRFEAALHTYFTVGDVRHIAVEGLKGTRYIDKMRSNETHVEDREAITFTEETDRIYESDATCTIVDPLLRRRIVNRKTGSRSTVVWNAFPKKAAAIGLAGDEWTTYVCAETAAIGADAIVLGAGKVHSLGANVSVERM
jgi:glucose-6-phosphate 1-epimerase